MEESGSMGKDSVADDGGEECGGNGGVAASCGEQHVSVESKLTRERDFLAGTVIVLVIRPDSTFVSWMQAQIRQNCYPETMPQKNLQSSSRHSCFHHSRLVREIFRKAVSWLLLP